MNDCVIYKKCAMIVIHTFPLHDQSKQAENGLQSRSGCHGLSWMTFIDDFQG